MVKPNIKCSYTFSMVKKKQFVVKQSCISKLQENSIHNHANNLQFAFNLQF